MESGSLATNLLFTCQRCGWWAAGTKLRAVAATKGKDVKYAVTCLSNDCRWSGELKANEAHKMKKLSKVDFGVFP